MAQINPSRHCNDFGFLISFVWAPFGLVFMCVCVIQILNFVLAILVVGFFCLLVCKLFSFYLINLSWLFGEG